MDQEAQVGGGWVRRHRRALAALLLSLWLAPPLLFAAAVLWFTAGDYPGFALAAGLALVWVAVRIRRRRLAASSEPLTSSTEEVAPPARA